MCHPRHTADRGISHPPPPPPPPSFPLLLHDFFLHPLSLFSLFFIPSSFTLSPCFFSLYLFLFLLRSVVPRCSSSSLSSTARRRPDERDNSSSIRLSTASLFAPLPITLFLLLSALREDFDALSAKGGASAHCSFNQERCTRDARQLVATFLDSNAGGCDKEFIYFPPSFFSFLTRFTFCVLRTDLDSLLCLSSKKVFARCLRNTLVSNPEI